MTGWLGVVSRTHVQRGVSGVFAQVCHGKAAPLRRMQTGDWMIYYSPTIEMGGEALRNFTALGEVVDDEDQLDLCAQPNWGMVLRRGHLKLSPRDFATITGAMRVTLSVVA